MDPYAYVGDNPETKDDPTGHDGWTQAWNVVTSVFNTVNTINKAVTNVQLQVLDFVTGASSMVNDVKTIFNGNASLESKLSAGRDLNFNAFTDVLLLVGIGEGIRGGELLLKGGGEVLRSGDELLRGGEDVLRAGEDLLHGMCSFTFYTTVTTKYGKQAIGTLHVGDKVLSYNPKTHKMEWQPILHVWKHTDRDLVDLTITTTAKARHGKPARGSSEVVHTTSEHPFFTAERGFIPVGELKVGMHVLRADGTVGVITEWKKVPGTEVMYNLEVAHDHTFTVGDGQWVVHNYCDPSQLVNPTARRFAQRLFNAFRDHLTPSDLEGAWRDLHGNPVPNPLGGFYNHIGEVRGALQSGINTIDEFKSLLLDPSISEGDRCVIQCLLSNTSKTLDYVEKVINRDWWIPGTRIPFW